MLNQNNMVGDPGHYKGANVAPRCSNHYSEGTNMLLLGKELNKRYKIPLTRYNGNDVSFAERARRAKVTGAKYCVSLHTNYPEDGVVVFISVNRPKDRVVAEKLGREVAKKLGIAFKGVRTRLYPGTNSTDYYAMLRLPTRLGLHGIIIEHGSHRQHCSNTAEKRELICDAYGNVFGGIVSPSQRGYLKKGDKGQDVKELQQNLLELGYKFKHNGKSYGADGSYGTATENAVRQFQRKNTLKVDGIAGKNTLSKIKELIILKAEKEATNDIIDLPKKGYWTKGDKDREITFMQEELNILGFNIEIDGIFGNGTLKAVKEFQNFAKIKVDGYVGPNTVKHIEIEVEKLEKNGVIDLPGKGYFGKDDRGEEVKTIQKALIALNHKIKDDGIYGPNTIKAIKKFQKNNKLKIDGYAGQETVRALNNLIKEGKVPIRRVIINGKQVGAYRETENILEQVKNNLNKSDSIKIEKKRG